MFQTNKAVLFLSETMSGINREMKWLPAPAELLTTVFSELWEVMSLRVLY